MKTRLSAIVRADACGLGTLSRMFADELGFYRTVSLARHAGGAWPEWFGRQNRPAPDGVTPELIGWLCKGTDVLLSFETWYGAFVPALAQRLGVKTALMPMYECCPQQGAGLEQTDLVLCPSMLDLQEMQHNTPGLADAAKTFLPVPFDTRRIAFRRRERALTFVHNAGHGGLLGRNSTVETVEAWRHVRSPARLLVRCQPGMRAETLLAAPHDARITIIEANAESYWDLWSAGDVLLHLHKFDGLSLPIQEAMAAGMPVMTTRCYPFCDRGEEPGWLPRSLQEIAVEPREVRPARICREIELRRLHPQDIAAAVDRLYGRQIGPVSDEARAAAERWSWSKLANVYRREFDKLVSGEPS
ncbi:MAG TPA: hypothetical protein VHC19_17250 [Pirellulales bacterium]|nr:hypothetical protein [Pirellulales bacterium]